MTEVLATYSGVGSIVSQSMVEVVNGIQPSLVTARLSQFMVEVCFSIRRATPGGGSGRWYFDLWFEDELWNEQDLAS